MITVRTSPGRQIHRCLEDEGATVFASTHLDELLILQPAKTLTDGRPVDAQPSAELVLAQQPLSRILAEPDSVKEKARHLLSEPLAGWHSCQLLYTYDL